ncbi:MAG: portal protein [Porticoccaceae bacterium]|nr:portal protein [Porticoccaceae bacterium]
MHDLSIAKQYDNMTADRESFLTRARSCSELTIPTLMPPDGHGNTTQFTTPYQSVGARGVNNLASKLLMTLLPPNTPFFRLTIDDFDLSELGGDARGKAEEALARIERSATQEVESKAIRVPTFEALKQLIVTGNALIHMPPKSGMKVFRLDRYVIQRDTMGNLLKIIVKETVSYDTLPKEILEVLMENPEYQADTNKKECDLFTCVRREGKKFVVHQEVHDMIVPSTKGSYTEDKLPWMALRFIAVDGNDYGRSFVEEIYGDLKSLESLTGSIVEGSAASAKLLFLVRPNGTTKARNIADAPNGAIISGAAEDVTTLQANKFNDFRVAQETMNTITERLAYSFLLNSSVQRNAERVTAEEIRYMAQELETALGGIYSVLSQEFQVPMVNLLLAKMQKEGKMPKFPKDTLKPQIVTGLEALGRGQDLNKLSQFLQMLQPLGAEVIASELNVSDYLARLGASLGIDTQGLVKSEEQKMQEQQAQQEQMQEQQMAQMAEKGVAPAVKAMSEAAQSGAMEEG